jgi:hypothetical protein
MAIFKDDLYPPKIRMTSLKVIVAFSVTSLWFSARAQDYVDLVKLNFNTTSKNEFKDSNTTTRIREIDAETTVPLRINAVTNFVTGFIYENINTRLTTTGSERAFGSAALKLGVNRIHSAKWTGTYMLLPKVASDLKSFTKKGFQLGAVALLKYVKNEQLLYKVGVYYNTERFGPWVVPLAGLYYMRADKKVEANVTLPLLADINYSVHKKLALGLNFSGQVRTYHLSTVASGRDGYVARSINELFGYLKLSITESFILQLRGGRSIGRHYRVYDSEQKVTLGLPLVYIGDHREQINGNLKDGWVYQAILLYRLHTSRG